MEHLILTETEFFRLIDNPDSRTELGAAYNEFTTAVVSLCTGAASPCHPLPALSYVETELQYHKAIRDPNTEHSIYVRKALAFVRRMLKIITIPHSQVPPLSSIPYKDEKKDDTPADAVDGQGVRPRGAYLRRQRDGLHQRRRSLAEGDSRLLLQGFRRTGERLLQYLQ